MYDNPPPPILTHSMDTTHTSKKKCEEYAQKQSLTKSLEIKSNCLQYPSRQNAKFPYRFKFYVKSGGRISSKCPIKKKLQFWYFYTCSFLF